MLGILLASAFINGVMAADTAQIPAAAGRIDSLLARAEKLATLDFAESAQVGHTALREARRIRDDKRIGDALYMLGYTFFMKAINDSALHYLEASLQQRRAIDDRYGIAQSLFWLGNVFLHRRESHRILAAYEESLAIRREIGDLRGIGQSLTNIANEYRNYAEYERALELYLEAARYFEQINDTEGLAWLYFNIGMLQKHMRNHDLALENIFHSLKLYTALSQVDGSQFGIFICYGQLGEIYREQDNLEQALKYHLMALEMRRKAGVLPAIADGYNGVGATYYAMGDYTNALQHFEKALEIRRAMGDQAGIAFGLRYIGRIYGRLNQYDQALAYLRQSQQIARSNRQRAEIRDNYQALSDVYAQTGNYREALRYHQKYVALRDSILNAETTSRIANLQIHYEAAKQERENQALRLQYELSSAEVTRQKQMRNFLGITLGLSCIGLTLLLIFLRSRVIANRLLTQKNREIAQAHQTLQEEVAERQQIEKEREKLIAKLQESLSNIKTLKGLVPICANCKKIRDDKGFWQHVETYIRKHSDAEFSHGICPECMEKLYPEYIDRKKTGDANRRPAADTAAEDSAAP